MGILSHSLELQGGGKAGATARAGQVLLHDALEHSGLLREVRRVLGPAGSGRGYAPERVLCSFMHLLHGGGRCLSDIRVLRRDGLFHGDRLPSADALAAWLWRLGGDAGFGALGRLHRFLLEQCLLQERVGGAVTVDVDDTLIATDKAEARRMYTGDKGFVATTAFVDGLDYLLAERLCLGNHSPGTDMRAFLDECRAMLPGSVRMGLLRSDSAGYRSSVLNWCQERRVDFVVAARLDRAVRACADAVPARDWRELPARDGASMWVAECVHILNKGHAPFRLILLRRQRAQAALQPSLELAGAWATSLDGACEEILALYGRRGECENRIKEWKSGFAAGHLPCSRYQPNRAWTRLNALAYNLSILIRRLLWKQMRWQMRTVRWRFWQIAGVVTIHARRWRLKVPHREWAALQLWRRALYEQLAH